MILFGNINKGLEEYRATSGAILVDVREADEFRSGHIGSTHRLSGWWRTRLRLKAGHASATSGRSPRFRC